MGQAPPGEASNFDGKGTLFVKAGEFGERFPIEREWTTKPVKYGRRGDVFICVVGATAGKVNLGTDCAIGRSVAAIRPKEGINSTFLYFQLLRQVEALRAGSSGSAQGVISRSDLQDIEVVVAPTNEQQRVVTKLDELLSDLDAGVAALKRARANLKRYRAAVLKAAVEGRLTAKWRAAHPKLEPASKVLERILAERRKKWEETQLRKYAENGQSPPKGWKEKYSEPARPDLSELPDLPSGWCWATVGQCAWEVTVGHVGPMKDRYEDSGLPFLRSQNVRPFDFDRAGLKFISEKFDSELRKSRLFGGEVLAVRSGNIGDACIYPETEGPGNCADLVITRLVKDVDARYVVTYLNSPIGRSRGLGKQT